MAHVVSVQLLSLIVQDSIPAYLLNLFESAFRSHRVCLPTLFTTYLTHICTETNSLYEAAENLLLTVSQD